MALITKTVSEGQELRLRSGDEVTSNLFDVRFGGEDNLVHGSEEKFPIAWYSLNKIDFTTLIDIDYEELISGYSVVRRVNLSGELKLEFYEKVKNYPVLSEFLDWFNSFYSIEKKVIRSMRDMRRTVELYVYSRSVFEKDAKGVDYIKNMFRKVRAGVSNKYVSIDVSSLERSFQDNLTKAIQISTIRFQDLRYIQKKELLSSWLKRLYPFRQEVLAPFNGLTKLINRFEDKIENLVKVRGVNGLTLSNMVSEAKRAFFQVLPPMVGIYVCKDLEDYLNTYIRKEEDFKGESTFDFYNILKFCFLGVRLKTLDLGGFSYEVGQPVVVSVGLIYDYFEVYTSKAFNEVGGFERIHPAVRAI